MNQDNGGIIGKINTPTTSVASGVWSIQDQFESQSSSIWPLGFPQTTFTNSCRLNKSDSPYLNRTNGTATNNDKYTFSLWTKRGIVSSAFEFLIEGWTANGDTTCGILRFRSDDRLDFMGYNTVYRQTTRVFRDTSAWYNIIIAVDTTQSTASDRIKMYINGVEETEFDTNNNPSQNANTGINNDSANLNLFRRYLGSSNDLHYGGYCTEYILVDGQQLTPTSFGATNPVTKIWEPIAYAGTYGTNGFKLNFSDSSALGDDTSGNGNDFTANNLASTDQSTDTCSNNFCLLNPLDITGSVTASEGNTVFQGGRYKANFGVSSGKWYWEAKRLNAPDNAYVGIKADDGDWNNSYNNSYTYYTSNGNYYLNGSSQGSYGSSTTTNDILIFALDMDNGKFYVGENGTFYNSGDPAAGSNPMASSISGTYLPVVINNSSSGTDQYSFNFGNPSFTISSGNADANGHGNFEYAPPSGFFALCTKNLSEFG